MSSPLPLTPEQRAQRWGTVAKWAAFAVFGCIFAPFAVATITGMLGLIVAAVIAATTWAMAPAIADGAKNLRLKMIKAEAARNPIETLEGEYLRRSLLLDERKTAIETFGGKTATFGDKLDGFKRDYPSEAPKYQKIHDQMQLLLDRQTAQWKEARRGLTTFQAEITKAKAMWAMALAAAEANPKSGLDEEAFLAQMKTETALDTIQVGMNTAFSQLDTLILESDAVQVLPAPTQAALPAAQAPVVIDVTPATKTKSRIAR